MANVQIVLAYASLLGLIFITLSAITVAERRKVSISLGAGDSHRLLRRIRAHANFAEYVPLALILIFGTAFAGAPGWFVPLICIVLVAGRLVHAAAILRANATLRVVGTGATLTVIAVAALFNLVAAAVA